MPVQVRLPDEGWKEVTGRLATGRGPSILNLSDCWLDQQQVFNCWLGYCCVRGASEHLVQQVSALEQVTYYQLSMEEGEVNDNTIKLIRAVNMDLTPAVWLEDVLWYGFDKCQISPFWMKMYIVNDETFRDQLVERHSYSWVSCRYLPWKSSGMFWKASIPNLFTSGLLNPRWVRGFEDRNVLSALNGFLQQLLPRVKLTVWLLFGPPGMNFDPFIFCWIGWIKTLNKSVFQLRIVEVVERRMEVGQRKGEQRQGQRRRF